jgi:predicted cobalt transporter CbtA
MLTYTSILRRALVAGAAVGLALGLYLLLAVEPVIDQAIVLEEQLATTEDEPHTHDEPLFTRAEQAAGGVAATMIYAVVASAVFATVFAASRHRLPGDSDRARSLWLAAVGFGTIALMPAIKYPANPPAVGDPDTVGERTILYLIVVVVSLLVAWLLTRLSAMLRSHLDDGGRLAVMAAATVAAYGTVLLVLPPSPDSIDPAVPAALIWDFRLRSIGGLALLWCGLGFGIGWLVERATAGATDTATGTATDTATGTATDTATGTATDPVGAADSAPAT